MRPIILAIALLAVLCSVLAIQAPIYPLRVKYLSATSEHKYYIEDGNQPSYGGVFEASACGVASASDPLNTARNRRLLKSYTKNGQTRLFVESSSVQPDGTWTFERNVGAVELNTTRATVSGLHILREYYHSTNTDYVYALGSRHMELTANSYSYMRDVAGVYAISPLQAVATCLDWNYNIRAYVNGESCPNDGQYDQDSALFKTMTNYMTVPSDTVPFQNQKKLYEYKNSMRYRILLTEGQTVPSGYTMSNYLGVVWTYQYPGTQALHEYLNGADMFYGYQYGFTPPCGFDVPDCIDRGIIGYAFPFGYYHCDGFGCPSYTTLKSCKQTVGSRTAHRWVNTTCPSGWTEDTIVPYNLLTYTACAEQTCFKSCPIGRVLFEYAVNDGISTIRRLSVGNIMAQDNPIGCALPVGGSYTPNVNPVVTVLYEYYNSQKVDYQYSSIANEAPLTSNGYVRGSMAFAINIAGYKRTSDQYGLRCNPYFQNC